MPISVKFLLRMFRSCSGLDFQGVHHRLRRFLAGGDVLPDKGPVGVAEVLDVVLGRVAVGEGVAK